MTAQLRLTRASFLVDGLDCEDEVAAIASAVGRVAGVQSVESYIGPRRTTVTYDPSLVSPQQLIAAIGTTGCSAHAPEAPRQADRPAQKLEGVIGWGALGLAAAVVALTAIGERIGLLNAAVERVPWWIPALVMLIGGWRVFWGVLRAASELKVTSHTVMTAGVVAAVFVGQWTTAVLLVFFMRFADWLEALATERSRSALRALVQLQPATARVLRDGTEREVPAMSVILNETVLLKSGDRVPVDGDVLEGNAFVDQAPITGESVPVSKAVGGLVLAATIVQSGFLKVRATRVGSDTTFAGIIRLVEEAEAQKAPVQRFADRFAGYYLPVVLALGFITFLVTGQVLNGVAVLVVACACAITMATPVVVLASVGNAARHGVLIKGGIALEQLARVDTVVLDKTGTITWGHPQVTDLKSLAGASLGYLQMAASLEQRSEHPLGGAVVEAAKAQCLELLEPEEFQALPGQGVTGVLSNQAWAVGNRVLLVNRGAQLQPEHEEEAARLEAGGKTVIFVVRGSEVAGIIAVSDVIRPEAKAAFAMLRQLGVKHIVMLTGDGVGPAASVAGELNIEYRAQMLPADKLAAIRSLQSARAVVLMVGDGVNDAPALAQADVGIAMGVAGTGVAIETADVALMANDLTLVPEAIQIGRRAARTIRQNLGMTAIYNVVGIGLAAFGLLPPVWAAAAQSVPDVAIMLNSARLLRAPKRLQQSNNTPTQGVGV